MKQMIKDQARAPSERLPEEIKVQNELLIQIGKPLGPTPEEVERIRLFPMRNYSQTVAKYEELLTCLKDRMKYELSSLLRTIRVLADKTLIGKQLLQWTKHSIRRSSKPPLLGSFPKSSKCLSKL